MEFESTLFKLTMDHAPKKSKLYNFRKFLRNNLYLILTILCIGIGIGLGIILNLYNPADDVVIWIGLPGELFIRALNFSVVPLLVSNIISMSSKLNPKTQGKSALIAFGYCVVMNTVGSFLGLGITVLINPGGRYSVGYLFEKMSSISTKRLSLSDVFSDFFRNMVPDNIVGVLLTSTVTTYNVVDQSNNNLNNSTNASTIVFERTVGTTKQTNILGVLMASLVIGLIAGSRIEKTRPFVSLAEAISEVMSVLIRIVIKLLPFAMISLIGTSVAKMNKLESSLINLILFITSSITFQTILIIVILPLLYLIFCRQNLFKFYKKMHGPVLTAFSSTSSLIALPQLFDVCDKFGVRTELVRTVAPFLTSFNANGSAAFISSAVCFVAQLNKFTIHPAQFISIGFLSAINVMALPAIPSASLITVFLIVRTFNIPDSIVSLLFVVEFIADRLRTIVNIISHGTCIMFLHKKLKYTESAHVINENSNQDTSENEQIY